MADKEIVNLPALLVFSDDVQIPVYVPGSSESAQKILGLQLREYAETAGAAAAAHVKKGDKGDPGDVSSVNGVRPDAQGNVALTATQIGALPLNGSAAMTGDLQVNRNNGSIAMLFPYGSRTWIRNRVDDDNYQDIKFGAGQLGFSGKANKVDFGFNILHTGNKPNGSYTGNGSAATRTISIEGIAASGAVLIKNGTNGRDAIVMNAGAIVNRSGTLAGYSYSVARFKGNAIVFNTSDADFNANGVAYDYWVL